MLPLHFPLLTCLFFTLSKVPPSQMAGGFYDEDSESRIVEPWRSPALCFSTRWAIATKCWLVNFLL
jgi:hypothetical protein